MYFIDRGQTVYEIPYVRVTCLDLDISRRFGVVEELSHAGVMVAIVVGNVNLLHLSGTALTPLNLHRENRCDICPRRLTGRLTYWPLSASSSEVQHCKLKRLILTSRNGALS